MGVAGFIGLSGLVIRDAGLSLTVIFTLRGLGVAGFIGLSGLVIGDAGLSLAIIFTLRGLGVAGFIGLSGLNKTHILTNKIPFNHC